MSALHQAQQIHRVKKAFSKSRLNTLIRQTRRGSAGALQDHYKLVIDLTTNKTGKHTIHFEPDNLMNVHIPGPRRNYFRIARTPNQAPYAVKPVKGKNKEWDTLQKNIEKLLQEIFKPGTQVRLQNLFYPNNPKRNKVFHITEYIWKRRPHPSSLGNYKFIIDVDRSNNLVVTINVKLEGHWVKDTHTISPPKPPPPPPKHFGERITRACDAHLASVRDLVSSYQESREFEKKVKQHKSQQAAARTRRNIRLRRRARNVPAVQHFVQRARQHQGRRRAAAATTVQRAVRRQTRRRRAAANIQRIARGRQTRRRAAQVGGCGSRRRSRTRRRRK